MSNDIAKYDFVPVVDFCKREDGSQRGRLDERAGFEEEDDGVSDLSDALLGDVDGEVGVGGLLVDVVDAGEALDLAVPGTSIDTLPVGLLAVLEGSGDVDKEEVAGTAGLGDGVASRSPRALVRSDGSGDHSSTSASELGGDESDSLNVGVTVLRAKAELGGELRANSLTEEKGNRPAALLVKLDLEGTRNLVFARVVKTGEEEGEALLVLGRVRLSESLDD